MRKIQFIEQLIKEEKIKIVEPSKEISISYNEKSKNSLKAAKVLLEQELYAEAISMAYYAMYHKTTSLFYLTGIKCENHSATIILLKELFKLNNKELSTAKKERVDKQYYTTFTINKDQVAESIQIAEKFINEIDLFVDKMTNQERDKFRSIFKNIYFE